MTQPNTTVLIADDHPIFRHGLKHVLAQIPHLRLVAEAESGDSALSQLNYLKPDIALLDLAMPGMDGLEVLKRARQTLPDLKVIIVTSYDDSAYLDRALELGASAYLLKDSATDDLEDCLQAVVAGETYISAELDNRALIVPNTDSSDTEQLALLTATERTVLAGVARFYTSKEIAREMDISYRTVQNHRANIAVKLDMKGRHQLVRFARAHQAALEQTD